MTATPGALLALAAAGLALLVVGVTRGRRPVPAVPDRDAYFSRWQALHGGYDPRTSSVWVRGWLSVVHALARPVARAGVAPDVVTLASAWLGGLVVVLAQAGGRWPVAAAWVVVASALVDSLDGCVAALQDRTTRWGYVLDSAVDRITDALWLLAVVAVGCPVGLAVATGFGCFFLEYLRARAGNAGGDEVARITVAERATRVLVLAPTLLACGLLPSRAPALATVGAAVLLVVTVVGIGQLGVAVRRQLTDVPHR